MFPWRLLNNGIAVGNRLSKFWKDVNTDCRLCNGATETLEHLFLYCPVSQNFLFAFPLDFRTDERLNLTVAHYIKTWLLEGGDLAKFKLGACLFWVIWKTRNEVIFNKGKIQLEKMLQETAYWHSLYNPDMDNSILPTEQDILDSAAVVWSPPPQPKMKINFDGAAGPKGYACAAVARNAQSGVDGCQAKVLDFISPVEAEAYGVLLSIELAVSKGFKQIIVEGDSLTVINALRYHNSPTPWRIQNTISRAKSE